MPKPKRQTCAFCRPHGGCPLPTAKQKDCETKKALLAVAAAKRNVSSGPDTVS
jgi:hypothetical protein